MQIYRKTFEVRHKATDRFELLVYEVGYGPLVMDAAEDLADRAIALALKWGCEQFSEVAIREIEVQTIQ